MARKTLLYDFHVEKLGATMGEFGGWEVPMLYKSAIEEHMIVRTDVGIFDVSHMGRIRFRGPDVMELIQYLYTKDMKKVKEGWMSGPTLALNQWARVKDDEMLYKISDEEWLVVANAPYREKMINYFKKVIEEKKLKVEVEDLTFNLAMIAIQGPKVEEVFEKVGAKEFNDLHTLEFRYNTVFAGEKIFLISRSGWTGEDGFEIWAEPPAMIRIYEKLLEAGAKPVGTIARDTLRIEMGFVLGEHEYGEDPTRFPNAISLRYGLGAIDWHKHGFAGEEALRAYRREGVKWIRVGLRFRKKDGRVVPRTGYKIYIDDVEVGWITSGTYSPYLKRGVAQAYIEAPYAVFGETVEVQIRNKRYEAKIVDFPLVPGRPVVK
ncbi:glycine cleavage system aminomethyltransferase GcvT [Desulfurococcaceae archaeon MEX13E-LK6-19]|nr:glycine cleavage system aminomethyltransferase GcvT [Desulfurococcaceae archaeon MEX13E-LK6-19]